MQEFYSSIIHNSPKLETTQITTGESMYFSVCCNGILYRNKKEQTEEDQEGNIQ